jgi:hypothetical protein
MRSGLRIATAGARWLGPIADGATTLWATVASGPLGTVRLEVTAELDQDAAEGLWRTVRHEIAASPLRGGAQLAERYAHDDQYVFVHGRGHDGLVGLGIVKRPRAEGDSRLRGIRVSTLSELLYPPSRPLVGLAVLRGAESAARALGADALLCGASAAPVRALVRRRGYLRLPANLHVLARLPAERDPAPTRIDEWWVTRGDSGGDGAF